MKVYPIVFKHFSEEHRREDNIKEFIDSLPANSIFYDLGANLGWFSLYAAALGHSTYAFEIDEHNFQGLEQNLALNPGVYVKAFNRGVADCKRKVTFRASNQHVGGHHKTIDVEDFSASEEIISYAYTKEVEVNSLDNYIKAFELPMPDYLKVDIDGSEHSFLLGAQESLTSARGMVIELFEENQYFEDSQRIIEACGFSLEKVYEIPGHKGLNNYCYRK